MRIINYGHACFKIIDDDISIVLDPYQDDSVPGMNLPENIKANYVFASHDHFDHNAVDKVEIVPTDKPAPMVEVVLPHDKFGGTKRGMSIAHIFKFSDYSICHMGDIGDKEAVLKCEELKDIDIVLCPINGYFTISAEDAIELQKKMGWKLLIPMHYEDAERGTGYPDGNQIKMFKKGYDHSEILNIGDYMLDINQFHISFKTIIFLSRKEGSNNND